MGRWLLWLGLAGLLALLLAPQWRSPERMGEARLDRRQSTERLVGVSWPFAARQDGFADGLALALDEINARATAQGFPPLRLVLRDDGDDWARARAIAMEFAATANMVAVVGYHADKVASQASSLFEQARLPHLIVGATTPALTAHGYRHVVRLTAAADRVVAALAAAVASPNASGAVALVWEEETGAKSLVNHYRIALDRQGGRVGQTWGFSRETVDFRPLAYALESERPQAVFFAGPDDLAGTFLRQTRQVGLDVPILGGFADGPDLRRLAGPGLEGAVFAEPFDPHAERPQTWDFVTRFRARFGRAPDSGAAQGHDALHLLDRALHQAGSDDPTDLALALRFMPPWEGAVGHYAFDGTGEQIGLEPMVVTVRNGQLVPLIPTGQ